MKSYPSLLPHLKRSVLSEDVQRQLLAFSDVLATKQVQDAAVQAVVTALADLPVECAVAVAGEIRSLALPGYILDADGRTARMPDYRNLLTRHPGLAMVYLFHGDCYMREAGLRTLRGAALTPFWIAAIILRLNDWVPEVRTAAMNCVLSILPETHARMLVDVAAGLLPRVRQWKRGPEELAVLDDLISAPGVFDGLMTRLAVSYDKAPHRILTAILKYPELDSYLPNLM
ncbi:MAG: hypothetical protein JF615_10400, partial [Asticcacaulis sp.]|nr:hypothetical protein [Asticcacaulis sp.]